jgi:hypothetical protein
LDFGYNTNDYFSGLEFKATVTFIDRLAGFSSALQLVVVLFGWTEISSAVLLA